MLPALAVALAVLVAALPAPGASGARNAPRAHAAASYMTGIGDEQPEMFGNRMWQGLHTRIARYIAPYDAAVRPHSLALATAWIRAAEAHHQRVLVAFYHSEYTPTKLPSVPVYQRDVQKFIKLFPKVRQYQSWDESNRGNVPRSFASPSAGAAARYYQALIRVCKNCTAIGLDVLDQANIRRADVHLRIPARNHPSADGHAQDLGPSQLLRRQPLTKRWRTASSHRPSAVRCG